jgi:CubicO group peptidase (beta-lactamase class C family)
MQLRDRGLLSLDDPVVKYVHSYSNPGVIFLGRIIQLLSGDDYERSTSPRTS